MPKTPNSDAVQPLLISGWGGIAKAIGRHKSTVQRMVERSEFPAPVYTAGQVAFLRTEVDQWLAELIRERDDRPTAIRTRADMSVTKLREKPPDDPKKPKPEGPGLLSLQRKQRKAAA